MDNDKPVPDLDWMALHESNLKRGVATAGGCVEWQGAKTNRGYGLRKIKGRMLLVHRISCMAHHGTPTAAAPYALHSCDNPACFNPAHLRWGTPSENTRDSSMRSERHSKLKLLPEQVLEIKRALAGGEAGRSIARRYGVGKTAVSNIKHGKRWSYHHEY